VPKNSRGETATALRRNAVRDERPFARWSNTGAKGAAGATDLLPLPLDREPQKIKSPKKPAKSHVKPQNPENPHQKIHK
jgi:hypothetical protein